MRLLFIRHGDPDYENDALTDVGKAEADALAKHILDWDINEVYLSPLGRARATAIPSIKVMGDAGRVLTNGSISSGIGGTFGPEQDPPDSGRETFADMIVRERTLDWLREFDAMVDVPAMPKWLKAYPNSVLPDGSYRKRIVWDMVPAYLNEHPEYFETHGWRDTELAHDTDIVEKYDKVCTEIDRLLAGYGYVRDGLEYRVDAEYDKTIAFFCHFGVTCVILSHFMNVSPFGLWHGMCLAPSSVTEVFSEERQQGCALFRTWKAGDVTHLTLEGLKPSFAARFCEVYSNTTQRH